MSLARLGPVVFEPATFDHYDPTFQWTGAPSGLRGALIGGSLPWSAAQALLELLDNPARRVTVNRRGGVLEYIYNDDELLGPAGGWHLLESFELNAGQPDSLSGQDGTVAFSAQASSLSDRRVRLIHSARERVNDYELTPIPILASPSGVGFSIAPSATVLLREFDASGEGDSQLMPVYIGAITDGVSTLPAVSSPSPSVSDEIPRWVADRGGDVRGFDLALDRDVYGPRHAFAEPSDIILRNGLIEVEVGTEGEAPVVTVRAFLGSWADVGQLVFTALGSTDTLLGARIIHLTPDTGTLALSLSTVGDVFLTIRRGERMVRIQHGDALEPNVSATRTVRWLVGGSPSSLTAGLRYLDTGAFTLGLGALSNAAGTADFGIATATPADTFVVGAFVATDATNDTVTDMHDQFSAECSQKVVVR